MIIRDAEESLPRCLEGVKDHVEEIILVLAGVSNDNTALVAADLAAQDPRIKVSYFEWVDDFAAARNFSFEQATGDWIIWLDDDDLIEGAEKLHMLAEEGEKRGLGVYHLVYHYRFDKQGHPTVSQTRERLMKRSLGWKWEGRVHEFCGSQTPHQVGFSDDVVIRHTTNEARSERNIRLLKMMEQENPDDPRLLACLGDYYQSTKDWPQAIAYYERAFDAIGNLDVKWATATELARSNQALKQWDEVERWCMMAISIHPEYSLPFLLLAHASWFGGNDAERALLYLEDADRRLEAPLVVFRQPEDYTIRRWDLEHRVYAEQHDWAMALTIVKKAEEHLGLLGEDRPKGWGGWDYFAWYYLERLNCDRSVEGAAALVDHLFRRGDTLRALHFLENDLPLPIRADQRIVALYERVKELTAHVTGDEEAYKNFYVENHYDSEHAENCLNGTVYEPYRMNTILARLKAIGAKRVLDVGCGAGAADFFLAQHGIAVVGIDINPVAVAEARRIAKREFGTLKKNGSKALLKPEFRQGSLDTIGPEDLGKFDAVLMMEVIEHLPPAKVPFYFSSCEDFLHPGGTVMITCPGMAIGDIPGVWSNFPRDHVQEFSRGDLERILTSYPGRRTKRPMNLHKVYDPEVSVPGFASWFMEYQCWPADVDPSDEAWQQPIAIYVGPGLEDWDASTPGAKGLGGSETWAVKVARELRAIGHPVIVYAESDEVWDGVIYRHHSKFDPKAPFAGAEAWLCIVSRYLEVLDERPNAKHVAFVAHDVDYGDALTAQRLINMDSYCVMSEWQRAHTELKYPFVRDIIRVISNGIDLDHFAASDEERQPHRFIWSSSPDRGLDVLLRWWPEIRQMWDDAELHIFYGWQNVDALSSTRPWLQPFKQQVMMMSRQPGVVWHDRIGQRELATEMQKSQFWLYPSRTPFDEVWNETFCITALEAQAGGCWPIVPECGALPERIIAGNMSESDKLELPDVLEALQALDNRVYPDVHEELQDWTWKRAADRLLAAVTPKVLEPV